MLQHWILWIHKRNNNYIKKFNPQKGIRLAKNKIKTKKFLYERWIPVPKTLFECKSESDRLQFDFTQIRSTQFVLKPNKWSKWEGIVIVQDMKRTTSAEQQYSWWDKIRGLDRKIILSGYMFLIKGIWISEYELKKQMIGIFKGLYNQSHIHDTLLIEEKLIPWKGFELFCQYGLADIRIIMFNLVPTIAMLRVPTQESGWKANLAQWGIGLWVDIVTGKITSLYYQWESYHQDFPTEWMFLHNKKVPYRQEILQHSSNIQYFVNSGYLGMDWVITEHGPKLLEINARSWLEIQNITGIPLLQIMKKIEDIDVTTPSKWLQISRTLFSTEKINELKDNQIIYLSQTGKIIYRNKEKNKISTVIVTVDLKKNNNYISPMLSQQLQNKQIVSLVVGDNAIIIKDIKFLVSDALVGNKVILWSHTLQHYYIKPEHKWKVRIDIFNPGVVLDDELMHLKLLDDKIHAVNKNLNLARMLRPINYLDEFDQFVVAHGDYNPQFVYKFPLYKQLYIWKQELHELDVKYRQKKYFESSFAQLLYDKIDELYNKIDLIKAYKKQDLKKINYYNEQLYGKIDDILLQQAEEYLASYETPSYDFWETITTEDAKLIVEQYLHKKKIVWAKVITSDMILSRMAVWFGKYATIKIKNGVTFPLHKLYAKLAHEIDIHMMRYLNGKKTGWNILATGTAWYIAFEEWLAIYHGEQIMRQYHPHYENIPKYKSYVYAHKAESYNFSEMFHYMFELKQQLKWWDLTRINYKSMFNMILRYKKWLKDTSMNHVGTISGKNIVYLQGYVDVKYWIKDLDKSDVISRYLKYGKCDLQSIELLYS